MHRQLASELPPTGGRRGLVLSASKEIEPGARAMLLFAEGLFRLDIVIAGDTLRTVVRNFSNGELEMGTAIGKTPSANVVFGEAAEYEPGRSGVDFALGAGADRVDVEVTIGTLRLAERGTIRVSAQGIVRQAAAG